MVLPASLPGPFAVEPSGLVTETGRSEGDIVKESVSQSLWEVWTRSVRRHLIRPAKRTGVTAEADHFQTVSGGRTRRSGNT